MKPNLNFSKVEYPKCMIYKFVMYFSLQKLFYLFLSQIQNTSIHKAFCLLAKSLNCTFAMCDGKNI